MKSTDIIRWSGMTHPGRFRKNNEDAFLGLILSENEVHHLGKEDEHPVGKHEFIFAVSDGMGGANAGDFASKLALQSVLKRLPATIAELGFSKIQAARREQVLDQLFRDIHDEIVSVGRYYEECKGMGATLSLIWLHENGGHFAHVGDSRIYRIPFEKPINQISEDHSEVGRLFRSGKLNERAMKNHPYRHILDQSLGGSIRKIQPQTGTFPFEKGDYLVLCSDGICDGLYDRTIEGTLIHPAPNITHFRPSERLVKEALFSSGKDNLTSLVIQLGDEKAPPPDR